MDSLSIDLRELFGPRPGRVLVVGGFADAFDDLEVRTHADPQSDATGGPFDTVLARLPDVLRRNRLAHWRELLEERGRLVLVLPPEARQDSIETLSELGFVLLEDRPSTLPDIARHLLSARRDDYRIRAYAPGDEPDILDLFQPSFHAIRSPEHWRWKFCQNPHGQHDITVAWKDSELVAHYAGYPVLWRLAGDHGGRLWRRAGLGRARDRREIVTMQVGDTMTRPSHRSVGRGPTSLLVRCVRHFYASRCEGRVAFNFGFNTGNIRKFSLRFVRAREVEPVPFWSREWVEPPHVPEPPAEGSPGRDSLARKGDMAVPISAAELDRRASAFDRFFERAAPAYGTLVRRDAAWLRWRYLDCPDDPPFRLVAVYRWRTLVGWSVFRRRGQRLTWCDALYLPRHASASRAALASALTETGPVDGIDGWFPTRPQWWCDELERQGFERKPEPNDLALLCVSHTHPEAAQILAEAYYTMGDGDLA